MESHAKFVLTPVAGAIAAALYPSIQAVAQDDTDSSFALEEIIVTATKREMSLQDIPASIQAITAETLAAMGAKSMEDYARFIPSVNVVSFSPGSSTIIFRGAITGAGYIAQSTSSVYVDEMSVTNTGSQPQIRLVDIARVEALSGPQGTLYGSDAQAGTMRIITNQPVLNEFEAIFDGEVRGGSEGEESFRGSLTLNVPLVEDKLALRLVGFNDKDGGFIDNVFGHTADTIVAGDWSYPAGFGTLDNSAVMEKDWNDSKIYGGRAALRWEISDNFAATLSTSHQTTDTGAFNDYDPFVGDLQTVRFHDEYRYEEFNMHSLVLDIDLGFAQLISATGYYDRDVKQLFDNTVYGHYWAAVYCRDATGFQTTATYEHPSTQETGTPVLDANGDFIYFYWSTVYDPRGPGYNNYYVAAGYYFSNVDTGGWIYWPVYCQGQTPESDYFTAYYAPFQDRKFTQEIRLSREGERFDWIVGFYYEDSADAWQAPFAEPTAGGDGSVNLWQGSVSQQYYEFYWTNFCRFPDTDPMSPGFGGPLNDCSNINQTFPNSKMSWYSQSHTDWTQKAVFGEIKWHINDEFILTLGGRYFERENDQYYLVNHPGALPLGPGQLPPGQATDPLVNGEFPSPNSGFDEEFIPKVSLSYAFGDDNMVYGLFTQGKRPGGVNRSRGDPFFPNAYSPDLMDNVEFGYKSTFANGQGRFNITAYEMSWSEYQLEIVDPSFTQCPAGGPSEIAGQCGQPWQQIVANVGDAHISGLNVELDYAPNDRTVLGMNIEFMEAETDTNHDLDGSEGEVLPDGSFDNEIVAGLRLPTVPEVKWSAWGEYHWPVNLFGVGNQAYVRTQWSYTGDSLNILEPIDNTFPNPQFVNEAYTIGDLRVGIQGEDWEVSVFVNNIADERAQYTYETGLFEWAAASVQDGRDHVARIYTNRPREFGIRYMKRWGD